MRPKPQLTADAKAASKEVRSPARKNEGVREQRKKLSYKEQRELEGLPERITALEEEQKEIESRINDPELYKTDREEGARLNRRLAEIEEELMACMLRWEELESIEQA